MEKNSTKDLLEANDLIWKHTFNYLSSISLKCAVQLGIPDAIFHNGKPLTLAELVKTLSLHPSKSTHLFRLMRLLVHNGFFAMEALEDEEEGYVLTPSSKLLLKDHDISLSPFLVMILDPVFAVPCHFTSEWFSGSDSTTPFEDVHGTNLYDYFSLHSEVSEKFNAAMSTDSDVVMRVLVNECKEMFKGFASLVDVAGGSGTTAKAISTAFPQLKCTVYDLPHVVSNMEGSSNLLFVAGNMFETVPSADIVLLKNIMQDWSDEECVKILKVCKGALTSIGKVIIIDMVINEGKGNYEALGTQLCYDVSKMALASGRERSETEWEKLFLEAGFASYKITPILGLRSVIEVFL